MNKFVPLVGIMAALFVLATLPTASASGQRERPIRYLAVGDSYSSGEGLEASELEGDERCQRARGTLNDDGKWEKIVWPALLAEAVKAGAVESGLDDFEFQACTGATTQDLREQISNAGESKRWDLITITVGGNDVDFGEIVDDCAGGDSTLEKLAVAGTCDVSKDEVAASIENLGQAALPDAFDQLAEVAEDGALILVLGYPQIIEDPAEWSFISKALVGCARLSTFDATWLRSMGDLLNSVTASAVSDARQRHPHLTWRFVDVAENFDDNTNCSDDDSWLHSWTQAAPDFRRDERAFHPNASGHIALAIAAVEGLLDSDWQPQQAPDMPDSALRLTASSVAGINIGEPAIGALTAIESMLGEAEGPIGLPLDSFWGPFDQPDCFEYFRWSQGISISTCADGALNGWFAWNDLAGNAWFLEQPLDHYFDLRNWPSDTYETLDGQTGEWFIGSRSLGLGARVEANLEFSDAALVEAQPLGLLLPMTASVAAVWTAAGANEQAASERAAAGLSDGSAVAACNSVPNFGPSEFDPICSGQWALSSAMAAYNARTLLYKLEGGSWVKVDEALTCCRLVDVETDLRGLLDRNDIPAYVVSDFCVLLRCVWPPGVCPVGTYVFAGNTEGFSIAVCSSPSGLRYHGEAVDGGATIELPACTTGYLQDPSRVIFKANSVDNYRYQVNAGYRGFAELVVIGPDGVTLLTEPFEGFRHSERGSPICATQ